MSGGLYPQQHQIQMFQQNLKQEEAQIEYYVYQDIQNIINLLYSREAVLQHFQNDQNNPMVTLSNNKIILQLNLSSGIHQDLKNQYQGNRYLFDKLSQEKSIALRTLNFVAQQLENQVRSQNNQQEFMNDPISNYLKQFMTNYEFDQFGANQFQLLKTNYEVQFNEQVLSKVISSMQTVDSQTNQLRKNGNYQKPTPQDLLQRAYDYYNMTKFKLNQNYSQNNQTLPQHQQGQFQNIENKQQFPLLDNQNYSNNLPQISSRVQECHIINIANPVQLNSSNPLQEHYNRESYNNNEKYLLIGFFQQLGYFGQTGTQFAFDQELRELYTQVKNILACEQNFSYPSIQFALKIEQLGFLQQIIILHYYFELFHHYLVYTKGQQNDMKFQQFVQNNHKKKQINSFIDYLFNQQKLIEQYLAQNAQMNNPQLSFNKEEIALNKKIIEEDYIWLMYKDFCSFYSISTN